MLDLLGIIKNYFDADLLEIIGPISPSVDRVKPLCPFMQCLWMLPISEFCL